MSIQIAHPSQLINGEITLTASKSISNRVLIIQALYGNDFTIENLAKAEDTRILQELLNSDETTLDVGLAGTTMRFLTAFLALKKGNFILTGAKRMKQRPIKILVEALKQLGADIEYLEEEGFPPLKIRGGNIAGGRIAINGDVSSQFISALLLIAPKLEKGLILELKGEVISKPYIDMTISIIQRFGAEVNWEGNSIIVKKLNVNAPKTNTFFVEADWSAASYWYGIAALSKSANITLYGLEQESLQGDAEVKEIYKQFGVNTEFIENGIRLVKHPDFKIQDSALRLDFSNCPDIAQTVAVTCATLNVGAHFTGLITLRIKETDRIFALQKELTKLGFQIKVKDNDLIILKVLQESAIQNEELVKTYNDHRMAMAYAPLGLIALIKIEDENVVIKSYPNFWEDLKAVGFEFSEVAKRISVIQKKL